MRKRTTTLKRLSVVLFLVCFGSQNFAGTLAQRKGAAGKASQQQQEQAAAKEKEAAEEKLKKDLAETVKAIEKNCNSLKDTIVAANVYDVEYGYDDNRVSVSFLRYCTFDGELSWTAEQKFNNKAHKDWKAYENRVTAFAPKLEASQAKENGVVDLISETATIEVEDLIANSSMVQVTWPLDLRDRKYAVKFVTVLKELAGNLKKRDELKEKVDKLAEEKAKAEEDKAKRRSRNVRRR